MQFVKVDVDKNAEIAEAAGISSMPTLKFYKNSACVHTMEGAHMRWCACARMHVRAHCGRC